MCKISQKLFNYDLKKSSYVLGGDHVPGVDVSDGGRGGKRYNCRHPHGRICDNIKYGLQQMKYRGQKEAYKAIVEAIVVGPEVVRSSEAEDILGKLKLILGGFFCKNSILIACFPA